MREESSESKQKRWFVLTHAYCIFSKVIVIRAKRRCHTERRGMALTKMLFNMCIIIYDERIICILRTQYSDVCVWRMGMGMVHSQSVLTSNEFVWNIGIYLLSSEKFDQICTRSLSVACDYWSFRMAISNYLGFPHTHIHIKTHTKTSLHAVNYNRLRSITTEYFAFIKIHEQYMRAINSDQIPFRIHTVIIITLDAFFYE